MVSAATIGQFRGALKSYTVCFGARPPAELLWIDTVEHQCGIQLHVFQDDKNYKNFVIYEESYCDATGIRIQSQYVLANVQKGGRVYMYTLTYNSGIKSYRECSYSKRFSTIFRENFMLEVLTTIPFSRVICL